MLCELRPHTQQASAQLLSHTPSPAVPHSKHQRLKASLKPDSVEQTQLLNLWGGSQMSALPQALQQFPVP